ncbi:MAG: ABC transporter ATP-binding protein [Eubacteriales bacterium]|nr:ABC transporter ATP-binding protein [Eubacteriales bacterium]
MEDKKSKPALSRLFELAASHKVLLLLSGIFATVATIASFIPYLAIYLIIGEIIDVYPEFQNINTQVILSYALLALLAVAADVLFYFLASLSAHLAAFGTTFELKQSFIKHITRIPLGFHLNLGSGRFQKVLKQDLDQMEQFIAHNYPDIVASSVAPLLLFILLFIFDWRFGLAAFIAVVLAFGIQLAAMGASGSELMSKLQKNSADLTASTVEYVRAMPVIKSFGQTARSFRQLADAIHNYSDFMLRYALKWKNSTAAFIALINNIYLFILPVGIYIGRRSTDYRSFLRNFLFYLLFTPAIASILHKFLYVMSSSMRVSGAVQSFDTILALPEFPQHCAHQRISDSSVKFEHVSFSYSKDGPAALSDISFTAPAGKLTAIVGPSGGGKSSIAHLIPRFWDVSKGRILIGDVDVREMTEKELMQQVSFVFQDVYLFNRSIRENICLGSTDVSDAELIAASQAACCHEFISKLPNAYDTVLGESGIHLSGGEAQRLSIARAMIRNTPILVLDEATAFADPENERLIQTGLRSLMEGKTVIVIAHRLSTIKEAEQILVMNEGRLLEAGYHDSLLESGQVYARLWKRYQDSLKWGMRKESFS